jgi:hypothetical protein
MGFTVAKRRAGVCDRTHTLNVEAIQQVQVIKGVAPVGYGQPLSASVNLITHSGTNSSHGSALKNFQSDRLNGRNQFLTAKSPERLQSIRRVPWRSREMVVRAKSDLIDKLRVVLCPSIPLSGAS